MALCAPLLFHERPSLIIQTLDHNPLLIFTERIAPRLGIQCARVFVRLLPCAGRKPRGQWRRFYDCPPPVSIIVWWTAAPNIVVIIIPVYAQGVPALGIARLGTSGPTALGIARLGTSTPIVTASVPVPIPSAGGIAASVPAFVGDYEIVEAPILPECGAGGSALIGLVALLFLGSVDVLMAGIMPARHHVGEVVDRTVQKGFQRTYGRYVHAFHQGLTGYRMPSSYV